MFKCFNDAAVTTKKKRKATEESEDKKRIVRSVRPSLGGGQVAREGMDIDYDSEATIPIMAYVRLKSDDE